MADIVPNSLSHHISLNIRSSLGRLYDNIGERIEVLCTCGGGERKQKSLPRLPYVDMLL